MGAFPRISDNHTLALSVYRDYKATGAVLRLPYFLVLKAEALHLANRKDTPGLHAMFPAVHKAVAVRT
jgi:hypothetical protein